jgi:hypothetical protein
MSISEHLRAAEAERDRLARIIVDICAKLSQTGIFNEATVVDEADIMPAMIGHLVAERDQLRVAVTDAKEFLGVLTNHLRDESHHRIADLTALAVRKLGVPDAIEADGDDR